jgi:hypothetical protein
MCQPWLGFNNGGGDSLISRACDVCIASAPFFIPSAVDKSHAARHCWERSTASVIDDGIGTSGNKRADASAKSIKQRLRPLLRLCSRIMPIKFSLPRPQTSIPIAQQRLAIDTGTIKPDQSV